MTANIQDRSALGVVINLVTDALMASVADWSRQLIIRSERHEDDHVLVAVQDSGVGIDPNDLDPPFNVFLTSKFGGMGMALSIRSIIEAHGARLRATANAPHGAIFHLSQPVGPASLLRNIALNSSPSAS
jgi:signal transduction histidine kinase